MKGGRVVERQDGGVGGQLQPPGKQNSCQVLGSNLTRLAQPQQTQGTEGRGGDPLRLESAWSPTQATRQNRAPGFQP